MDRRMIVCTGNAHKVTELGALLPEWQLEPLPDGTVLPPEIGQTFTDNARIKAYAGNALYPDAWILADDSGLSVDVLDGAPGVHSARYAGADADDRANTRQLLERMRPYSDPDVRSAHFTCVLVLISPEGEELIAKGTVAGTIVERELGGGGFGYDPVFVPEGHERTFGQLGADVKAELSHRARAARALQRQLVGLA